jgi:MOSC domain-containing protein YiiM
VATALCAACNFAVGAVVQAGRAVARPRYNSAVGILRGIWVKRSHGGVMDAATSGELVAGRGLRGNATQGGRRQVTILSLDRWRALTAHLPGPPSPAIRRANLLVEGVDLDASRGRMLRIGQARVRIFGETRPCHQMDEACPGLQAALDPPWAGGAFGEVVEGGEIAVGAAVAWEDAEGAAASTASTNRTTPSSATP